MKRTMLRHGLLLLTAGIGASLGHVSTASAADPVTYPAVLKLAPGIGGELKKNGGPGNEQLASAVFNDGPKQYVVSIYMSSNVDQQKDGYWQCKCSSVLMDPTLGPLIVADQVQLTHNGGERPCNHPRLASDGTNYGVWTYGTNETNNNTRTYVQAVNNKCELMSDRLRISEDDNQNEGAPEIKFNGKGWFTAGYLSTANNDKDHMQLVGVTLDTTSGKAAIAKMWSTNAVAPSNIGRPTIAEAGTERAFYCASKGNQRPPETGVECGLIDSTTGKVVYSELIAASDPGNKIYMNSPTVVKLSDNLFAVEVIESSGNGKKTDNKGKNYAHMYAYKVSGDSFTKQGYLNGIGVFPTHSSICAGTYGEKGANYVGVIGLSPTGLGQPSMQFMSFDGVGFKADKKMDLWTVGYYGDSGLLSNLYGPNPNTQGRDFPQCVGGVKNPGFGAKNGYMSNVETFFLVPHAGNNLQEPKNAAYLTFVPGKVAQAVAPQPPDDPKKAIQSGSDTAGAGGVGGSAGSSAGSSSDGGSDIHVSTPGAAGCSIPASGGSAPSDLAFLALGVSALFAARRRR